MQIVINIPEETYNFLKKYGTDGGIIENSVVNGTPLPKGHGDLIDRNALSKRFENECVGDCDCCSNCTIEDGIFSCYAITSASTIIEADKE